MNPILLAQLTLVHFISDFLLQNDWMAINKSKKWFPLMLHSTTYGLPFLVFGNVSFVAYLITTHYWIDFITSKITSCLWQQEKRHYFFCMIGFDQWLHFLILLAGILIYNIRQIESSFMQQDTALSLPRSECKFRWLCFRSLMKKLLIIIVLFLSGCSIIGPPSVNLGKWYHKHVSQTEEQAMNPCVTIHTWKF